MDTYITQPAWYNELNESTLYPVTDLGGSNLVGYAELLCQGPSDTG